MDERASMSLARAETAPAITPGKTRPLRKPPSSSSSSSRGRSRSRSPSRGHGDAELAGSRSATRLLPVDAAAFSPKAEPRRSPSRSGSRQGSRQQKALERAEAAEAAAVSAALLEDQQPLGLTTTQPLEPLPAQLLFERLSYNPLKKLDFSHWTDHIWPSELQRMLQLNSSWEALVITNCDALNDAQCDLLLSAFGPRITHLDLSGCCTFSDFTVKKAVNFCSSLGDLHLKDCSQVTDRALRSIATSGLRLHTLNLENCFMIGDHAFTNMVAACPQLTDIDVSGCRELSDRSFKDVGKKLSLLTRTGLNRCPKLTDEGLLGLLTGPTKITSLRALECSNITDIGARALYEVEVMYGFRPRPGCEQLVELELSNNATISEDLTKWLWTGCANLRKLNLESCQGAAVDHAMTALIRLERLEWLSLANAQGLTDEGCAVLGSVPHDNLTHLNLSSCENINDEGVRALTKSCRKLEFLDLSWLPDTSDSIIQPLTKNCPRLKVLRLCGSRKLTDRGIGLLTRRNRIIVDLDLRGCVQLTHRALRDVATLRNLEILNISSCAMMSDALFKSMPRDSLQVLRCANLAAIGDDGLRMLTETTGNLKEVDVSGCSCITKAGIESLVKRYKHLRCLETTIDEAALKDILDKYEYFEDDVGVDDKWSSLIDHAREGAVVKVKHPYLRTGAEASSIRDGNATGNQSPRFRGLRYSNATRSAKVRQDHFVKWREFDKAAVKIQQGLAYIDIRRKEVLAAAKAKREKSVAMVSIQLLMKGLVAKRRLHKIRRNKAMVAGMLQASYRLKKLRRQWAAADANFRSRCKSNHFVAYKKWYIRNRTLLYGENPYWVPGGTTLKPLHACDLTEEEIARAERGQAMFWKKLLFGAWFMAVFRDVQDMDKEKRAVRFWEEHYRPVLFYRWRVKARASHATRVQLSQIFMLTVKIETQNSSSQLFNRARSDAYYGRMYLAWIWIGIKETSYRINKERRNKEKAEAFARKMFREGPLQNSLNSLRWYKNERRLKATFKRNAIAHREVATTKATLRFLNDLATKNKDFRLKAEKAMKMWANGIMQYLMETWKDYVVDNKWRRKQRADAAVWFLVESQRRRLLEWKQTVDDIIAERNRRKRMLEIAKNFYSNQCIMVPFKAWKMLAENAGNEAAFAEKKAKMKLKKEVMMTWKTWLKKELYEKEQLRKKEELWREAATKVQSIMRMCLGKKKFLKHRMAMGWGVVKIQAQARMKSAMNLAKNLRRKRDLRRYKAEENENDIMEAEDNLIQYINKLTSTSIKLQSWARGCLGRWYCIGVRIEFNKGRMKRWLIEQERKMREAEAAAIRREEERKAEEAQAVNIQRYYRGMMGRKRFMFIWAYSLETKAAVTCQRIYRGRRGRRVDEATRRANKLHKHHYAARKFQGHFLRAIGLKNRRTQRWGLRYLAALGLDGTSFMTDWKINLAQVAEDFGELTKEWRQELAAWREEPPFVGSKHKRQQARARLRIEGDKFQIHAYDAVKVIGRGQGKNMGFSGYIMSIDKTTPGRPLAEMSMDLEGKLAYIPVLMDDGETNNLFRVDKMVKKKAIKNLKPFSRRHMLMWSKKEAPRWEAFLAARTIQLAARSYVSYRRVARVRYRYWKKVKERRLIFLQTLNSFGFNWLNSADTLRKYNVADGLKYENFSAMPVRYPVPPKLYEELEIRRHKIMLAREFRRKVRERRKYQNDYLFDNKEAMAEAPSYLKRPVRRLVPINYKISRQTVKVYKHTFWKLADLVKPARFTRHKGEGMQYFIASLIGGAAWQRTADELKTWSGRWGFPEFEDSPHCRICNTQVFHGCWEWNKPLKTLMPQGEGCVEMLQGYGVAKEEKVLKVVVIKARGLKAMDSNGFSDPYVKVECNSKSFKTPYVSRNLNPVWHEVFEIDVTDPDTHVQFSVWDYDVFGSNDYMGGINVELMDLKDGNPMRQWFKLKDYDRGVLVPGWGTNKGKGRKAKFGELELQLIWSEREQEDDVVINRARLHMSTRLQSWTRMVLSKMALAQVREERRQDLEMIRIMVIKMQCGWRGRRSRRELRRRKRRWAKAIVCEMAFRAYTARKELARRRVELASALVMQAAARRRRAYVNVFQMRLVKIIFDHLAIIQLQCVARQFLARRALATKREELIDEGLYRPLLKLVQEDGTPSKKWDMSWLPTYGTDEEFASKRLARISYRALGKLLIAPGPKAIVVTLYGNADINEYPLPDEGMTTFDEDTMDDVPLRDQSADMVRVLMHGYCDMPLPLEQRIEIKQTAKKHMMVLRMKAVLCEKTMNRYCTFIQCAYRQQVAWREYAIRKRLWDLATRIERFYKKRFAKRVASAEKLQTRVRMMAAHMKLVYKQMELAKAIMIQCRWRQVRATRKSEDQRTIPTVEASATSSDFNPTFSGSKTLEESLISFWCSAEGETKNQWVMYDLGRPASIGILRIRCPVDASAPKHCTMQTADNPFDDFDDLCKFELHNRNNDVQSVYIKERRIARFWRFYVRKNHGSKSSVSLNYLKFLIAPESSVNIVEDPATVNREPGPLIGHRDDDIILTCRAEAWPPPTYQWRQNGRDLKGATDRILNLKVQRKKSRETKKYRCTHCRKVKQDLPKNIYKCKCKNCGWLEDFPEQVEANKERLYITEQDSKIDFVLKQLQSMEEAINENITTMKRQLLSEQLMKEQRAAKAGGGLAAAADKGGDNNNNKKKKAEKVVVVEEDSDDDWDDDKPKFEEKVIMWEEVFLRGAREIPNFVDQALNPDKQIAVEAAEEATGDDDEERIVLRPCDVLANHAAKFNDRYRKMDKRPTEDRLRGMDMQLEFVQMIRAKTLSAQEVLVFEKYSNSKDDPVHQFQMYSCEGIFTCMITNLRGATVEGEGGVPISKETRPCCVLVGDPVHQVTKVTNDYTPKVYQRRKKFPKYTSIHGWATWGHFGGDVIIRYDNGHVYAGPYVLERWLNSEGNTEHQGRDKDHWGTWITTDDHIYEGLVVDNHFDMRAVIGDFRVTYPNAEIYEGQYLDNHRHGVGEYSYDDGCLYEGEFYIGVRQGYGVLRSPNGALYEGEWDHDTIHGEGLWSWPDGSSYMGTSVNGVRTGKGLYCNKDGGMYYGDFKGNQMEGQGIFNYVDNSRYEGGWKANLRDGKAVFTDPRNVRYIGTYRDDMRHGEFIVRRPTLMPGYQEGYKHGEGDVFEDEVQKGLWENGKFVMWLSEPVSPLATLQFIERFEDENEFDGTYALMIARRLPRLPHGVQGDHAEVVPIIERIREEGGELVATETYAETLRKVHELEPVLEKANKDNQNAQMVFEAQTRARNVCFEVKESCRQDLEKYEQRLKEILNSIELFFADDTDNARGEFLEIVEKLSKLSPKDCFEIRQHNDPSPVLEKAMNAACQLCLCKTDWKSAQMLLATSTQNKEDGDAAAAYVEYDVKMQHLMLEFDVWKRCEMHSMLGSVSGILTDPRMKPNHFAVKSYGKALVRIVDFVWKALAYIRRAKGVLKKKLEQDATVAMIARAKAALDGAMATLAAEEAHVGESKRNLDEATRVRDFQVRRMKELQALMKRCREMIVIYNKPPDHELDVYELQEQAHDETDRQQVVIVMELMLTKIEQNSDPYPEIDEDPILDIIEEAVPKYHAEMFKPVRSGAFLEDGSEEMVAPYYYDAGELLAAVPNPPVAEDLISSLVENLKMRINAVLNQEPDDEHWAMHWGHWPRREERERDARKEPTAPGKAPVYTVELLFKIVRKKWFTLTELEANTTSAAAWTEVQGDEAARESVRAKYNPFLTERPAIEARCWRAIYVAELVQMEETMAFEFEQKFPSNTSHEALRLSKEFLGDVDDYILASNWVWVHPDKARKAQDEIDLELSKEFVKAHPEDTQDHAAMVSIDADADPAVKAQAEAWAARHAGMFQEGMKKLGVEASEAFQEKFSDDTAIKAVRALESKTAPMDIKRNAAAWGAANKSAFNIAKAEYAKEQQKEDEKLVDKIMFLKKALAPHVETIQKAAAEGKDPQLNVDGTEALQRLKKNFQARLDYNELRYNEIAEQLEALEKDTSYRVVSSKMRPSEAVEELKSRAWNRDRRLEILKKGAARYSEILDGIWEEREVFFPTPPPPEIEVVDGWEHHWDEESQAWYWLSQETGEAVWEEEVEAEQLSEDEDKDKKKKKKKKDKKDGDKKGKKKKK